MKSLSTSLVSVALFVAAASAQFQINTPNPPTQCVPVQFNWQGGNPPYFLAITPGGQPGAAALQQYTGLTGNSFTWSTNITAGTSIGLTLTDSTGAVAQSAPVTIQSGPDSSCLNGGSSSGTTAAGGASSTDSGAAGASSTATTPTASGAASTGAATSGAASGTSSSGASATSARSSGTSASGTPSASATGGNNGALGNVASVGLVGVLSAVAAALLA